MGRKILADAGYEVITVNNGSAALKKIAEQKPDLIVLDVYMPGYSGLEVCQRLKEAQETARVPVLLTVGKLEPFKPEEAKRVRADGFIVKPFEASELLSALSKLEDKIVPRGESSKPGRFARVTASIEQGRYDKTVAIEEDLGWKDRISFPSKKKKQSDEPSTYDAANRDSATLVEHKLADKPEAVRPEEDRVDLGALAPEGLPKDVTPEEIAALAAAAAQVKGKIADPRFAERVAAIEQTDRTQAEPAVPAAFIEHKSEEKSAETFTEKIEGKVHAPQIQVPENQVPEEKIQVPEEKSSDAAWQPLSAAIASPSDVIAAIAGLGSGPVVNAVSSGNGVSSQGASDHSESEPVTMARAGSEASRWTAVSVGLDPEEAAISLEHEMQKAYAAFAAAESGHAASVTTVPEIPSGAGELAATEASASPEMPVPVVSIPAMPAPEVAQTLSALAHASTDAIRAAVQELEMVAESYLEEPKARVAEGVGQLAPEMPRTVEAVAKENSTTANETAQSEGAQLETAKSERDFQHEESRKQEPSRDAWKNEEPFVAVAAAVPKEADATTADVREVAAPILINEVAAEQASVNQVPSSEVPSRSKAVAADESAGESTEKILKHDSEAAATPAAAWASWRRIRESGDSTRQEAEAGSAPQTAAMAVAAGAEKTPEEKSAESDSDPAAIASIVDSVLADLRPRIFEEISRKMGKKK
jgi:CheY-like chemotaxis protein